MARVKWVTLMGAAMLIALGLAACAGGEPDILPTQTPAVVIVTSTPEPAPEMTAEPLAPDDDYPPSFSCGGEIIEQPFENGRMFWLGRSMEERCRPAHSFEPGSGEIFVLIFDDTGRSGIWRRFVDEWDESRDPVFDPALEPPEDLLQPVRGFGFVWREMLTEEERAALGWAALEEIPYTTDYQYESGGFVTEARAFVSAPGVHVLLDLGRNRFELDEASFTFTYTPAEEIEAEEAESGG
ncbi:MAG: hypothetical protein Kow00124_05400 [Anaerolineae bacterium]